MGKQDQLPTTREEWAKAWPNYQERFLAWCNATRKRPTEFSHTEYTAWISRRSAKFRADNGIERDFVPASLADAFTNFLWEGEE